MNDIVLAIIASVSGGGIAGLLTVLQRRKLIASQANKLDAEASRIAMQTLSETLEKLRKEYNELSKEAETLRREINRLKREFGKLPKVIGTCQHADSCPVTQEIQFVYHNTKKNEGNE